MRIAIYRVEFFFIGLNFRIKIFVNHTMLKETDSIIPFFFLFTNWNSYFGWVVVIHFYIYTLAISNTNYIALILLHYGFTQILWTNSISFGALPRFPSIFNHIIFTILFFTIIRIPYESGRRLNANKYVLLSWKRVRNGQSKVYCRTFWTG